MKDLAWWVLKENIFINIIYRYFVPFIFRPVKSYCITNEPIIDKSTVKKSGVKGRGFFRIKGYTSGTTNEPLTVYRSIKSILLEEYIVKSYLFYHGAPLAPRIAVIRGDHLFSADHKGPNYWLKKPFTRRLFLSSYHISEQTAPLYLKQLEVFKPDIIMAYPSSIYLLAKFADQLGWKPNWGFKCVFTSSEFFSIEKQDLVRSVFGKVLDHYGQAERVAALQLCTEGHYHVREDYSFVEFIKNEHGMRIVGTNIHNSAMQLTRYDTNDYVEGVNFNAACPCGNSAPFVKKILGRDDDYFILPNGSIVGRLDVAFKGMNSIVECQIEQVLIDKALIRYVPRENYKTCEIESELLNRLRERLGEEIQFEFIPLDYVPRTKAGKFRSVIRDKSLVSP